MDNINNYNEIAKKKVSKKKMKLFFLAVMAGMFIAFASLASTIVTSKITNFGLARILSGIIFPIGLILVILLKAELFTGNILLIIPVINKKIKIKDMLLNWIIVYIGNFIGSITIAILVYYSNIYTNISNNIISIATTKINYSIGEEIILGLLCNILVTMAVYLGLNAKNNIEKIFVIFIPILLFIVLGLEHSIANMYYLSIGYIVDNSLSIILILKNLLFVTIGNIIGGTLFGISQNYLNNE